MAVLTLLGVMYFFAELIYFLIEFYSGRILGFQVLETVF